MKHLFLILLFICAMPQTCGALEITFAKSATVEKSVITLGDIARFSDTSELAKALSTQIVGQSPVPGETIFLRSIGIKRYLVSTQSLPGNISWQGSPTVTLKRAGITIGPDKILTIIKNYIEDNKENLPEADISFLPTTLPIPFTLPVGKLSWEVIPSHPGILRSSRFSMIFRIDGKVVKNMSVRGSVKAIADVVIASQSMARGSVLHRKNLKVTKADISAIPSSCRDLSELVGKKLKRHIKAGTPILLSMVEALPVVRSGERVKIIITSGSMILTATGLAYSDGQINQMIRVQNLRSRKIVYCRVAAPGLVEVLL